MSLYACAVLLTWSVNKCHSGTCALYYPIFNSGCTCITFHVSVLRFESLLKYEPTFMLLINIWILISFCMHWKECALASRSPTSVWAVKFSVSPQSSQAWRIKCKAADKQLISITGGKSVNVTSPDECSFYDYISEKHTAFQANGVSL